MNFFTLHPDEIEKEADRLTADQRYVDASAIRAIAMLRRDLTVALHKLERVTISRDRWQGKADRLQTRIAKMIDALMDDGG